MKVFHATFAAVLAAIAIGDVHSLNGDNAQQAEQFHQATEELKVGEYYKPSAKEASGAPDTTAAYHRSPCPALNALANHGYLPRNGQNISKSVLKAAVMDIFSMANDTASTQVGQVPDGFSLTFLSRHNALEHDASLVHSDAYFGSDPMVVNTTLADDLLARSDDADMINTTAVAHVRRHRAILCETTNPECTFGAGEKKKSFNQASLLLLALGGGDAISVDHARSFLVDERIPSDFVKSATPVTVAALGTKSAELVAQAV
ncbi:hypothetical protein PHYBOEH_008113 [Phytophthora boehmeriae]|uniref:Heme haloperoxidase family profile domain-containing protein n=1 Tax=Phytophthora boehmeriae TaxID=109152 RepID=A0A8T1W6R7_9STRA|nr:hypothetical protein PHYBOEH_008113 [Phytophthora boehmeriae]